VAIGNWFLLILILETRGLLVPEAKWQYLVVAIVELLEASVSMARKKSAATPVLRTEGVLWSQMLEALILRFPETGYLTLRAASNYSIAGVKRSFIT